MSEIQTETTPLGLNCLLSWMQCAFFPLSQLKCWSTHSLWQCFYQTCCLFVYSEVHWTCVSEQHNSLHWTLKNTPAECKVVHIFGCQEKQHLIGSSLGPQCWEDKTSSMFSFVIFNFLIQTTHCAIQFCRSLVRHLQSARTTIWIVVEKSKSQTHTHAYFCLDSLILSNHPTSKHGHGILHCIKSGSVYCTDNVNWNNKTT